MSRVVVPVGFNMGAQHRYVRPPDPQPECFEVHLGADVVELEEDEASVYAFAFLDVGRHARLEHTRDWLVRALSTAPRPQQNAERLVTSLLDRGLLVEFDPDGPLEDVFGRYRLFPTGEGMGTTPERPDHHRVGQLGNPLLTLPNTAYTMWAFSFLHANLWKACEYLAAADREDLEEGEEPLGLTPDGIAREVAANLPAIVATRSAFIDPAVEL